MSIKAPKENKIDNAIKPFCCKFCGSEQFIKYGIRNGKQNYLCKSCNRKFVDNQFFEGLKYSPKVICVTLDLYFKGISLRRISDHLRQFYNLEVHYTTVYHWIVKYIEIMDNYVSQFKPSLGITWNADEMMVSIKGDWYYLWNVVDADTRFHLASIISKERKIKDARKVFQEAKKTSHNNRPRRIIIDGLHSYHKAVNKEFYTTKKQTVHLGNYPIRGRHLRNLKFDNNKVERLHGEIRNRNKTQRGLKSENTPFIKGHRLYHNFIRSHKSLNSCTPAEASGININLYKEKWENLLMKSIKKLKNENL